MNKWAHVVFVGILFYALSRLFQMYPGDQFRDGGGNQRIPSGSELVNSLTLKYVRMVIYTLSRLFHMYPGDQFRNGGRNMRTDNFFHIRIHWTGI